MTTSPSPDIEARLNALRRLLTLALAVNVIIAASVAWYFRSQKQLVNVQLSHASMNVNQYEKQVIPRLNALIVQLQEYSRTHPDINPILAKYGMLPGSAPAPASQPAVAPKK